MRAWGRTKLLEPVDSTCTVSCTPTAVLSTDHCGIAPVRRARHDHQIAGAAGLPNSARSNTAAWASCASERPAHGALCTAPSAGHHSLPVRAMPRPCQRPRRGSESSPAGGGGGPQFGARMAHHAAHAGRDGRAGPSRLESASAEEAARLRSRYSTTGHHYRNPLPAGLAGMPCVTSSQFLPFTSGKTKNNP